MILYCSWDSSNLWCLPATAAPSWRSLHWYGVRPHDNNTPPIFHPYSHTSRNV
jgi:hypothetical protein